MKYHYQEPNIVVPVYGLPISLDERHPVYSSGTLYFQDGKGLIVTQKKFYPDSRGCMWSMVDPAVANDIYLSPKFPEFFKEHAAAAESEYPIFQLRKLMWTLRMKPLKKEPWEDYF